MILITKENLDKVIEELLSQGGGEYSVIVDSLENIQLVSKSVDGTGQMILLYKGDNNEKSISGIATWLKDWFYEKNQVDNLLSDKVDVVSGKGLSTNDYTTAEKNKLSDLSNYTHPSTHSTDMIKIPHSLGSFFDYAEGTSQTTINEDIDTSLYNLRERINTLENKKPLWNNIENKPASFPPSEHSHNVSDIEISITSSGGLSARPGTLDEYLEILQTRIDSISATGQMANAMADVLTHINEYYEAYE